MVIFVKLLAPVLAGGLVASMTIFGVVYSQTQAPETNPASKPILTYGDES